MTNFPTAIDAAETYLLHKLGKFLKGKTFVQLAATMSDKAEIFLDEFDARVLDELGVKFYDGGIWMLLGNYHDNIKEADLELWKDYETGQIGFIITKASR